MDVKNAVMPTPEQIQGFLEPGPEGPIYMVNLLKYRERAEYADGRETDLTGREAYDLYAAEVSKLLHEFGGGGMFHARVTRLMLGEVDELWDDVAIAVYPSREAMFAMMRSDKMGEIGVHRAAGLSGQLNIETADATGLWLGSQMA